MEKRSVSGSLLLMVVLYSFCDGLELLCVIHIKVKKIETY